VTTLKDEDSGSIQITVEEMSEGVFENLLEFEGY